MHSRPDHHDFAVHHQGNRHHGDPLLKRCWVLQERLLSPRVLYYDANEILWECKQRRDCHCGAMVTMLVFKDYLGSALRPGQREHMRKEHPVAAWMKILHKYTAMQITVETDRLIALEGIVKSLQSTGVLGDYIAGMWAYRLERQISWYVQDTFAATTQRLAPSWSWASRRGGVTFGDASSWSMPPWTEDGAAQILSVAPFTPEDPKSGRLRVRSSALEATATVVRPSSATSPATYRIQFGNLRLDIRNDLIDSEDIVSRERTLILLFWGHFWYGWAYFLVLQPGKEPGFYQRFGQFTYNDQPQAKEQKAKLLALCEERTVDII
jgi:hypothetical protein